MRVQLLVLPKLVGVDDVTGGHVGTHLRRRDLTTRPVAWFARVHVEGADLLVRELHRDPSHRRDPVLARLLCELRPQVLALPHVGDRDGFATIERVPARSHAGVLLAAFHLPDHLRGRGDELQPALALQAHPATEEAQNAGHSVDEFVERCPDVVGGGQPARESRQYRHEFVLVEHAAVPSSVPTNSDIHHSDRLAPFGSHDIS